MVKVNITGKKYTVIEQWNEITINQAAEIYTACDDIPDKLLDIYQALSDKDKLADVMEQVDEQESIKDFPVFYGKIIEMMSDIPAEIIDRISWNERTAFYNLYLEKFIIGLLLHPFDYKAENIKSFTHEGKIYLLPETKTIINDERTFAEATAVEFAESADLELHSRKMKSGKYGVAANIISILCRPKGEKYNEATSLKRAEGFGELTMDVFWEVFFCLDLRLKNFKHAFLTYTVGKVSKAKPKQRSQVLKNLVGMVQSSA